MDLDGLALDEHRLERLDTQTVERRRAVQEDRVFLDDLLEHIPYGGTCPLDHPLRTLDVLRETLVDEPLHDERLEQLEGHLLGQPALVQPELRADNDDRTARVVHALSEQVLAEPPLLSLEHVAQRLQRTVAGTGDRTTAAAVVEQRVDGLLQHPLLVVDDDLGRLQVEQPLQPVVPVDDAAVQVVQVRRREPPTVELHHWAQVGRDDRNGVEHHPHGRVAALGEVGDHLQSLDRLQPARPLARRDLLAEVVCLLLELEVLEQALDGLGAHAPVEVVPEPLTKRAVHGVVGDELLDRQALEGREHLVEVIGLALRLVDLVLDLREVLMPAIRIDPRDDVRGEVDDPLEVLRGDVEQVTETRGNTLEVPDVGNRGRELDVAHAVAADLRPGDLHAAAFADDSLEADALVLAAVALPVPRRTEDPLAEQAVLLRLQRPVVDRLRLLDLAVGPGPDLICGSQPDPDLVEVVHVKHS